MKIYENLKNNLAILYFNIFPSLHGRGYTRYRDYIIKNRIKKKKINQKYFCDERIVEIPWVFQQLKKLSGKLLDAGSTLNIKYILSKLKNFDKIFITTLYPENLFFNNLNISYTYEDLSDMSFKNNSFDAITCISTLEHIGFDNSIYNYGEFKKEKKNKNKLDIVLKGLRRVLKKNGILLITIPFGKKGIYNNMQQFDIYGLKHIIKILRPKKFYIEYYKVLNNRWIKVNDIDCENVEPNIKSFKKSQHVLCANSIALIKIIK